MTNNVTPIRSNVTDEEKAYELLMMHYNRVVVMDEVNPKAIKRAGVTGKAIRDLLDAVSIYSHVRQIGKVNAHTRK